MAGEHIRVAKMNGVPAFLYGKHVFDAVYGAFVGLKDEVVYARTLPEGKILPLSAGALPRFKNWLSSARSEQ